MVSSEPLQSQPKTENKAISSELLAYFETEGEIFLSPTVTANETWAMSRHHPQPHRKKVSIKSQRAPKLMITVFWDCEGVTLLNSIPRGETINSDTYIRTLTELWKHFKRVHALYDPTEILLEHDNAIPHTSLKIRKVITKFDWTALPYPPYSPVVSTRHTHTCSSLVQCHRSGWRLH
jgi:hypothetical protein